MSSLSWKKESSCFWPAPTVIRLLPPLVITKEEIDKALKALREVLS